MCSVPKHPVQSYVVLSRAYTGKMHMHKGRIATVTLKGDKWMYLVCFEGVVAAYDESDLVSYDRRALESVEPYEVTDVRLSLGKFGCE